jgi:hypothetical protein
MLLSIDGFAAKALGDKRLLGFSFAAVSKCGAGQLGLLFSLRNVVGCHFRFEDGITGIDEYRLGATN